MQPDSRLDDPQIRAALRVRLQKDETPLVVEEFELLNGQSRIDLFLFDKCFRGIEIKSERDSLARLPRQIEIYNRYLETIEIVVAPVHMEKVLQIVPRWWGITAVDQRRSVHFSLFRAPTINPLFQSEHLLEFLWRDEVIELLAMFGVTAGVKSLAKFDLRVLAKKFLPLQELNFFVYDFMQKREDWRGVRSHALSGG